MILIRREIMPLWASRCIIHRAAPQPVLPLPAGSCGFPLLSLSGMGRHLPPSLPPGGLGSPIVGFLAPFLIPRPGRRLRLVFPRTRNWHRVRQGDFQEPWHSRRRRFSRKDVAGGRLKERREFPSGRVCLSTPGTGGPGLPWEAESPGLQATASSAFIKPVEGTATGQ